MSQNIVRRLATATVLLIAAVLMAWQYRVYFFNPWTRDGIVQSRVALVTPLASGRVSSVHVRENQFVRAGERLFSISPEQGKETLHITAPEEGYITGLLAQPNTNVVADTPLAGIIVRRDFHVVAFFRETVVGRLAPGLPALVTLMSYPQKPLAGVVESIGWGIARSDGSSSGARGDLLPQVSPSFEWIRLAQRIPVHIRLTDVPEHILLRMGTTASVLVRLDGKQKDSVLPLFPLLQ